MSNGLYNKYIITKANGHPIDPEAFYFVLKLDSKDPVHAKASKEALWAYAQSISGSHLSHLANDLIERIKNKQFCKKCGAGIGFWAEPDESPCRCPENGE